MKNQSRRGFIAVLTATIVAGCAGTTEQTSPSESTDTPTPTPNLCDDPYESDAEQVSYQYGRAYDRLTEINSAIGDPQTVEQAQDSVFGGGSALYKLQCETSPCEDEFYEAIETFRAIQEQAETTREDFNTVETMATSCDIELTDYVTSAATGGAEIAGHLASAAEAFEQSAQNQIDDDNSTFQSDESFETGMDEYNKAENISIPPAKRLDNRLTVYSGETPQ